MARVDVIQTNKRPNRESQNGCEGAQSSDGDAANLLKKTEVPRDQATLSPAVRSSRPTIGKKIDNLWRKRSDFLDSLFQELQLAPAPDRPRWSRAGHAFIIEDIGGFEATQLQPRFCLLGLTEFQVSLQCNGRQLYSWKSDFRLFPSNGISGTDRCYRRR
jgi:hypothetical protein